nr:CPBP family intramembrane metalloprotease [Pseudopedobacter sp.]
MLKQLLSYIKGPTVCSLRRPKVSNFISLFFINLIFTIPIAILINVLLKRFSLTDTIKSEIDFTSLKFVFIIVILAPIFEEIFFRSLLRFTKQNFILFSASITFIIAYEIFKSRIIFVIILTFILFSFVFFVKSYSLKNVALFINSRFKYFFYGSSLIFGLLHASNYEGNLYLILLFSFILGGRQIIGGFILGFIRMNYGLVYSILFHITLNAITTLLFIK